ncbi:MAG: hypothetical protein A2Y82_01880 [Candidatus Buchananbacteria bacterium RBG_13_36_9]|uniref:Glycosyl transferase family 1 domain-containing protein n=1 Tax=Candidatus Buchananbacteria bacterium RBG_13_36_9 TaxID=1797530 RepID=A0A1G1XNE4_9BACT|nr:MAG: hypothetical protein A2Y82_01880 [Candidatus Buchananbacteria bacterium RBG_13_36_9]
MKTLFIIHRLWLEGKIKQGGIDFIVRYFEENHGLTYKIEHPFEDYNFPSNLKLAEQIISNHQSKLKPPFIWFFEVYINLSWTKKIKPIDIVFASDPLNFFSCYLLKKLGWAKKIWFHSVDYSDHRFNNRILNRIYKTLYKLAVNQADLTTVVTQRMENLAKALTHHQERIFFLPNSPLFNHVPKIDINDRKKFHLALSASKLSYMQWDKILQVLIKLQKDYPQTILEIVGFIDETSKSKITDLNLSANIICHGINPYNEALAIISRCQIGLSWYVTDISHIYWGDSLKIREYAAAGLPTVCDDITSTALEMAQWQAGFIANTVEEMAAKIAILFNDHQLYKKYSANALNWAASTDKAKLLANIISKL